MLLVHTKYSLFRFDNKNNLTADIKLKKIDVFDNSYDETDPYNNGEYAGLLLIQSYGQATTSWNNCKINIDRTKHNDNMQVWYTYTGGNDTPINETNCPTVTVDGVVVMKSVPPVTEETPENVETSEDETKTE